VPFDQWLASTPLTGNIQIELQEDTARCESMTLAIHAGYLAGKGPMVVRGTRNPTTWCTRWKAGGSSAAGIP
jgi:hypothetical protein